MLVQGLPLKPSTRRFAHVCTDLTQVSTALALLTRQQGIYKAAAATSQASMSHHKSTAGLCLATCMLQPTRNAAGSVRTGVLQPNN